MGEPRVAGFTWDGGSCVFGAGFIWGEAEWGTAWEFERTKKIFYSKNFLRGEISDLGEAGNLIEGIVMMRVVTRRLLKAARGCKDMKEVIAVWGVLGLASTRVAGLIKAQRLLGGNKDRLDVLIENLTIEILDEHGFEL